MAQLSIARAILSNSFHYVTLGVSSVRFVVVVYVYCTTVKVRFILVCGRETNGPSNGYGQVFLSTYKNVEVTLKINGMVLILLVEFWKYVKLQMSLKYYLYYKWSLNLQITDLPFPRIPFSTVN